MRSSVVFIAAFLLWAWPANNAPVRMEEGLPFSKEDIFGEWRILRFVKMPGASDAMHAEKFIAKRILLSKGYSFYIEVSCTAPSFTIEKSSTSQYLSAKYAGEINAQQLGIKTDSIYVVHLGCAGHAKYDNTVLPDFGGDMIYDGKRLYCFYHSVFFIAEKNDD